MSDRQEENYRDAILKKEVWVAEIEATLSRPPVNRMRGGVRLRTSMDRRLRLREEVARKRRWIHELKMGLLLHRFHRSHDPRIKLTIARELADLGTPLRQDVIAELEAQLAPLSARAALPATVDRKALAKLTFKKVSGRLIVEKPFTDEELLNTYEELFPLMDQIRTRVLERGNKVTADELQSMFKRTLLGKNASKENWKDWISDFCLKTKAKAAALVFLEQITAVPRETLKPRFSRARKARKAKIV
jgi:hypothetical protein